MHELVVVNLFFMYFPFLVALGMQDCIDGIFFIQSPKVFLLVYAHLC